MGWEERNGRRYYYRKERTPEGVRSVYIGNAPGCDVLAECIAGRRLEAAAKRRRLRRTLAPYDSALSSLRDEAAELRTLARAYLVATGHRTHNGQWRRARYLRLPLEELRAEAGPLTLASKQPPADMARKKKALKKEAPVPLTPGTSFGSPAGTAITIPGGLDEGTLSALGAAIEACNTEKPKAADVTRLREALLKLPASAFEPFVEREARRSAAALLCGDVNVSVAFVENEAERFACELAGPFAGPLVRAAAEHAATARVVLDAVTERYGRVLRDGYSLKEGEHFERRLSAAQRRYLRALATVAALRRAEESEAKGAGIATPAERASERSALQLLQHAGDSLPAPEEVDMATS